MDLGKQYDRSDVILWVATLASLGALGTDIMKPKTYWPKMDTKTGTLKRRLKGNMKTPNLWVFREFVFDPPSSYEDRIPFFVFIKSKDARPFFIASQNGHLPVVECLLEEKKKTRQGRHLEVEEFS